MEPWIEGQLRTMTRWVAAKTGVDVQNLPTELGDGLLLIKLINAVTRDLPGSSYTLTPVHKKPKLALQKVENVSDALEFCRLVLKINTCNICAEDVLAQNLKLVLGLIWALFVFSSANVVTVRNEVASFSEIKRLLLKWINDIGRTHALPEVSNFSKDWSLQQQRRPDLIFAAILENLLPGCIDYASYRDGKPLANLSEIIALAKRHLEIPDLAIANDFNVLFPDEKCVLFYVLEWHIFYKSANTGSLRDADNVEDSATTIQQQIGQFVSLVVQTAKLKNKYDTRALRLSNRINMSRNDLLNQLDNLRNTKTLVEILDSYCCDFNPREDVSEQVAARGNSREIQAAVDSVVAIFERYEKVKFIIKPDLIFRDFPELLGVAKGIEVGLKDCGVRSSYTPLKQLTVEALRQKLDLLSKCETRLCVEANESVQALLSSKCLNIEKLLLKMEAELKRGHLPNTDSTEAFMRGLDCIQGFVVRAKAFQDTLVQNRTTSDIKVLASSVDLYDLPKTPLTPSESPFDTFVECISRETNKSNLTFLDLKRLMRRILASHQYKGPELGEFIRLIPTRTLVTCHSDASSNSSHLDSDGETLFDKAQRDLESRMSGTQNKLYDLQALVIRIESGFDV